MHGVVPHLNPLPLSTVYTMSSRLLLSGLCIAACSPRGAAFVSVAARPCGTRCSTSVMFRRNMRNGFTVGGFFTSLRTPRGTGRQVQQDARPPACCWRGEQGRSVSSKTGLLSSTTTEQSSGQDAGEVFDVYLPPDSLSVLSAPPKSAGFTKARGLVHKHGDWHRSVHIWLHNGKGELVLQKRSSLKDTFPGMWDVSVGGHFTSGDSSLETAIKETEEELGLECDESALRFVCTVATSATGSSPDHREFVCNEYKDIYLLRYDGLVEDLQFSPDEVEDVKLVHMDQLKEVLSSLDPAYIPRPEYYTDALFAALKEALKQ